MTVGGAKSRDVYRRALLAEIDLWSAEGGGWDFDTVYLGGGTPSALAPEVLAQIVDALSRRLGTAGARLHLEANPEDVTQESAARWRDLGVRFLSLGVQSFRDDALAFLGRRHDGARARESVGVALAAGFDTVSLDLIYGLPDQTPAEMRHDLDTAISLGPGHLSCYQLTVEPGTVFGNRKAKGRLVELPDPQQADLFLLVHRHLAANGYTAYEVSNFARTPAHRSRHNRKYWLGAPYLGLGPSAHSFDGARTRWWNHRTLSHWRAALDRGEPPVAATEHLDRDALALERLMLGLRTTAGLDLGNFRERFGIDLEQRNAALLGSLETDGLARRDDGRLALTLEGLAIADGLAGRFEL